MKFFAVLLAVVGAASAGLAPVLLPKVNVAPTQVNIVRQPVAVTQPELVYRNVPVPVRAVAYTNPVVSTPIVAAPAIATHAIAAPAISTYAAAPIAHAGLAHVGIAHSGLAHAGLAHAPLTSIW